VEGDRGGRRRGGKACDDGSVSGMAMGIVVGVLMEFVPTSRWTLMWSGINSRGTPFNDRIKPVRLSLTAQGMKGVSLCFPAALRLYW
jgi:hypothetical protein